ncbi:ATP-binding cassette domain-containing protein [Tumebacillus sp. ITR2]|uniref:ATP-binding cassette domain-containing protein n=1 Tax=Tumebacillus amylolyticus TaxID=2801339 RepID=A0ABS1J991_9BACL|nr:ATP-binding cassette domain-containing protein [Tumebacillus amylolyticus]MBL0386845.1 ATP-binding cassette domain-containing protein [Tumebacillus amylolyticus]
MKIVLEGINWQGILRNVSCEIGSGITLLIGRTGAGKSTLLDVLTGLQKPTTGSVQYGDLPLWDGNRVNRTVQNDIGVVFQSPEQQLFAKSVEAEFAYSLKALKLEKDEVGRRTRDALQAMGLSLDLLPQSPLTLSGGQKRRVALGTTLAVEPSWLFLDEPTAGLDPQSTTGLVKWCQEWVEQQAGGGLVIVTHDLDAFFPIADRVLVVAGGQILADTTPDELCAHPNVLHEAGIGLPESLQTVIDLRQRGFKLPQGVLSPDQLAAEIARQLHERDRHVGHEGSAIKVETKPQSTPTTPPELTPASKPLIYRLDPRGKWVFYVALSVGLLMQSTWLGLLVGTILTLAVLFASQSSYRELLRVIKPFLWFLAFSVVLSGLQFSGGLGFSLDSALYTFTRVFKVLLVLILGFLLSATTGQLRMKRALEQALAPLARLKLPVEAFALAVSLLLRFIPVILRELQRFSRITRARGRSNAKLGGLRVRDIPVLVIPLLLSVLQLGEELSTAMEARGYQDFGKKRTQSLRLQLHRADWLTMGLGILLSILLIFL